jgi:nucleoside phosphorylase
MAVKVLVVDDDDRKMRRVKEVIEAAVGSANVVVTGARSAASAARCLESEVFDLLVLDIRLPARDDAEAQEQGGLSVLRALARGRPGLKLPSYIVGLTAYSDKQAEFHGEFANEAWQLALYSDVDVEWQQAIANRVVYVAQSKSQNGGPSAFESDLFIVTALKDIELDAVLELPASWRETKFEDDATFYYRGTFEREGKQQSVVAAAAHQMGMASTACLCMKAISRFRPRYIVMCGICAGVDGAFGDVVFADQCWDYGSGKVKASKSNSMFSPAPSYLSVDASLKENAAHFVQAKADVLFQIERRWRGEKVGHRLSVHVGPIATGAAVVESEKAVAGIVEQNRKVKGIEMEAYGVFVAAQNATAPRPTAFVAKGICDFGVPPKTDDYQKYAAFCSANFVMEYALAYF